MIAVIFFKKGPFLVFVGIALHHRWNAGITRLDWFPPFIICLSLKSSTSRLSWLSYNSLKVANLVEETEELLCKLAVTPKTAGLTRAYKGCFAGFEHGSFFFYLWNYDTAPRDDYLEHPHHCDVAEMLQQAGCPLPFWSLLLLLPLEWRVMK